MDKVRQARLRLFGHVQRKDSEKIGQRMLTMKLPGRRKNERLQSRFMDVLKEDRQIR